MIDLHEVGKGHPSEHMYLQPIYEIVKRANAQNVLEIGSGKFTFSRAILKGLEETNGLLWTCDPKKETDYTHPQMFFQQIRSNDLRRTWYRNIDVLMIDGDHRDPQVSQDFANFIPFVLKPGYVIFHDINIPHGKAVRALWQHLKTTYSVYLEIDTWPGLGVIEIR